MRNSGIDSIAGFFVLYIAVGHALSRYGITTAKDGIFPFPFLYFFMPWFFFKGGMYFKHKDNKTALMSSYKRLIIPFIVYSVVGCVIYNGIAFFCDTPLYSVKRWAIGLLVQGSIDENKPLWFLLSLFFVKLIANKITPPNYSKVIIYIFIAIGILIASLSNMFSHHIPFWLFNTASGLVYFLFGYLIKETKNYLGLTLAFIIWFSISFFMPVGVDMRHNTVHYGYYWTWWLYSLGGIYLVNTCVSMIPSHIIESKYNFLRICGEYSMEIYVTHWIVILIPFALGMV